ncbi:Gfo/Idh/MocA family oxidoreductase [Gryllotalpicola daejeonensis]|uniref:Gfo/Idh/MocA family oxidoreductase n=1 Tax=Gryllotalpicola daejeonensis TaxID=993087 RepID=A0ABP7ZHL2_9MICO
MTTRLVITGVGGFGRTHLENARRLEAEGRVEIVATVDPAVPEAYGSLGEALAKHPADIVIVATPPHTHFALAEQSLRAGADVLLEKPPLPSLGEFERLLALEQQTGHVVQVGFQSLGSHAIEVLQHDVAAVSATGLWSRTNSYWTRSRWAGKRTLDGRPVVDGVATNALAHAVATALRIAGYDRPGFDAAAMTVEVDAYRVNDIETDDTTSLRVTGPGMPTVTCALSLCAPPELVERTDHAAVVQVTSPQASAQFSYTTDVVTRGDTHERFGRTDLLENLLDHRDSGAELIVPLHSTAAFQHVLEALRVAPPPAAIPARHVTWHGEAGDRHPIIADIERLAHDAAVSGRLFRELPAFT